MATTMLDNDSSVPTATVAMSRPKAGGLIATVRSVVPGLLLTFGIAAEAFGLRALPGLSPLSPMILSIFIGIALNNLFRTPTWAKPGVAFSLRRFCGSPSFCWACS